MESTYLFTNHDWMHVNQSKQAVISKIKNIYILPEKNEYRGIYGEVCVQYIEALAPTTTKLDASQWATDKREATHQSC